MQLLPVNSKINEEMYNLNLIGINQILNSEKIKIHYFVIYNFSLWRNKQKNYLVEI